MLLSADSLAIIFVKIYCYWTSTVGVIAKGSRVPFFFETVYIPPHRKCISTLVKYKQNMNVQQ